VALVLGGAPSFPSLWPTRTEKGWHLGHVQLRAGHVRAMFVGLAPLLLAPLAVWWAVALLAHATWPLYLLHAVLTGTSMALVNALGVKDGFGFSAGAIDYVLNFTTATRPLALLVVGVGFGVVYYVLFRVAIRRFDLATPGRGRDEVACAGGDGEPRG